MLLPARVQAFGIVARPGQLKPFSFMRAVLISGLQDFGMSALAGCIQVSVPIDDLSEQVNHGRADRRQIHYRQGMTIRLAWRLGATHATSCVRSRGWDGRVLVEGHGPSGGHEHVVASGLWGTRQFRLELVAQGSVAGPRPQHVAGHRRKSGKSGPRRRNTEVGGHESKHIVGPLSCSAQPTVERDPALSLPSWAHSRLM